MPLQNLSHPDALIIIFVREPVYGQVKTRLIPALGEKALQSSIANFWLIQ